MDASLEHILIKKHESKSLREVMKLPPDALQGVSAGDAEKLKDAFGIKTVQDLARNKFFLWAQALDCLAAQEK
ncbi:MAG: hypothetical protein AAFY56_04525 [Pseudomonadota bacterium]